MKVWCESVWDTAIAKTEGSFDAVNNNQSEIKIAKPDAKALLGFIVGYNATVVTDGENTPDLVVRVNSKALGISDEDLIVANGGCDANATNDWAPLTSRFIPFTTDKPEKLSEASLTFKASPTITNTGGLDVVIGAVYSDAEPDSQFAIELMTQMHRRVGGGAYEADPAKAHGTGLAFVDLASITIPAGTRQLEGILAKINPNGITASDPIGGVMEFLASGIPDFSPQVWPLCTFWNPVLGTTVSENAQSGAGRYYPTRFPLTGKEITVSVKSMLIIAAGAAPDTTQGLLYS